MQTDSPHHEVGELLCYVGASGRITCHRVVGQDDDEMLLLRGDAQATAESIAPEAVVYVVRRVEQLGMTFDLESPIGRRVTASITTYPKPWRTTAKAVSALIDIALLLRHRIQ